MPKKAKKDDIKKDAKSISGINKLIQDILYSEKSSLEGIPEDNQLNNLYKEVSSIIKSGSSSNSTTSQDIYNYLNTSFFGNNNLSAKSNKPKKNDVLSRANMDKLFSGDDVNAVSFFTNSAGNFTSICDEIDSVCIQVPQLENAIDIICDSVLTSDDMSNEISINITFDKLTEENNSYVEMIKNTISKYNIHKKLKSHIIPKMCRYGMYHTMIIPYSELGYVIGGGDVNNKKIMEASSKGYNNFMTNVVSLTESQNLDVTESRIKAEKIDLSSDIKSWSPKLVKNKRIMETINYNLDHIYINESKTPPNVTPMDFMAVNNINDEIKTEIEKAMNKKYKNEQKFSGSTEKSYQGVVNPNDMSNITGCYIKMVDPRQLIPIKIFEYILGYYYFENYNFSKMGSNISDVMAGQLNFDDRNIVIDNIVSSVLSNLKYGDILQGNDEFKSLVLNCILFSERLNNPLRIKFVPTEYVVTFSVNEDENGYGESVILKSLHSARMYSSLKNFMYMSILTKSNDSEFYYINEGYMDNSPNNRISETIDEVKNTTPDLSSLIRGDIGSNLKALSKRYFLSKGVNDIKPFEYENISGQQIDTHNDFIEDYKTSAINLTTVPSMITENNEADLATKLIMANSKFLKSCNSMQIEINPSITELIKKVQKASNPGKIPEDILDSLKISVKKSTSIPNTTMADMLNTSDNIMTRMVELRIGGIETEGEELTPWLKEEVTRRFARYLNPSLPWDVLDEIIENSLFKAKENKEKVRIKSKLGTSSEE